MNLLDFFRKKEKRKRLAGLAAKPENAVLSEKKSANNEAVAGKEEKPEPERVLGDSKSASSILRKPNITEKSSLASEEGVYTFQVDSSASKHEIKKAVEELYGVEVMRVNVINMPHRLRSFGRKFGRRPGYRKALVYLAEGQKIEYV